MQKPKRKSSGKRGWRIACGILIALAVVCVLFTVLLHLDSYGGGFANSVYAPDAFSGQRVLFLVPHEDDDIAMAGGTIKLYVDGGADVRVAFATNGDIGSDPNVRVREALRGLQILGVPEENVTFLGYGDRWDYRTYKHIYHAPDDALIASESGRTQTYGAGGQTELHSAVYNEPATYTRANFLSDIRTLLVMLQPDTVFCIDLDSHPDHAGLSWMFEEAMAALLKSNANYRPKVYKGYAYSLSWYGANDFYAENAVATRLPYPDPAIINDTRFLLDNPAYSWAERVRFPMPYEALSYTLRANIVCRALAAHASQDARDRAKFIISGDTVFFERRTDSLLYLPDTVLTATSGDVSGLNDFKLVDTNNLMDAPMTFDKGLWQPDATDPDKRVTVQFPARVDIASVSLYDDCYPDSNILSGQLTFSDGSTVPVGALNPLGQETVISFPEKRGVTSFTFSITDSEGDTPGLTELCAYAPEIPQTPTFIKLALQDESESFLYRFQAKAGGVYPVFVYAYPHADVDYTIAVTSKNDDVAIEDGVLRVAENARPGKHLVTVSLTKDQHVFDTIEVVVPSVWERIYHRMLSLYERCIDKVEYHIRRIFRELTA